MSGGAAKRRRAAAVLSGVAERLGSHGLFGVAEEELVRKAAEASRVSTDTVCGWLTEEQFREQFRSLADRESDAERGAVWRSLVEQCAQGNLAAIKLYFELKDGAGGKGAKAGGVKIVDDI